MLVRRLPVAILGLAICCCFATESDAAPPWQRLALFKRIEANPEKSYALTEDQGPWLILVTTFVGEGAEDRAQNLCLELRKEYKLYAYTHRKVFNFTEDDKRNSQASRKVKYRNAESEEVAVLVGDFQSVDDEKAQKTLRTIKNDCQPKCMLTDEITPEKKNPVTALRGVFRTVKTEAGLRTQKKERSLLANAHLTTNPLLPDEYYAPKGLDKFVIDMNKPLEHSLLKCRGKYTVKVATFSGRVIIDQKKVKAAQEGEEVSGALREAEDKAHRLTQALRDQGYEAYEFHDRGQSIVTVGSFDTYGSPRADGKIEINPMIFQVMNTFGADKSAAPGQASRVGMPKVIAKIPLDVQPMIVETPKRSIGSDYVADGGFLGRK